MSRRTNFLVRYVPTFARILLVVVAAAGVWGGHHPIALTGEIGAALYLIGVIGLGLLQPRPAASTLNYLIVLADIGIVTLFAGLSVATEPPLWVLYVIPLLLAAWVGPEPLIVATLLGLTSLTAVDLLHGALTLERLAWPGSLLVLVAVVLGETSQRLAETREEQRALGQVAEITRALSGQDDLNGLAGVAVEGARSLAGADTAWLWSRAPDQRARLIAETLPLGQPHPVLDRLDAALASRLAHGPVSLGDVKEGAVELWALGQREQLEAVLGLRWKQRRPRGTLLDARMALFAAASAEAFRRVRLREATNQELQRERLYRQTAISLASVRDEATARAIVDDARSAIQAASLPSPDAATKALLADLITLADATSARCDAYQRLEREVRELQASFEAIPAPLVIHDAGTILRANAAYRSLEGPDEAFSPPPIGISDEEVVIGDPPRTFLVTTLPLDGSEAITVYREITREREALQAKDDLIAMIGHELRNPLTSIHGYSQMMARQLGIVQDQVDRLNHMIGDFMEAARLEGGHLPIESRPVDLVEVVHSAVERFKGAHPDHPLRLDLPDRALVDGDPSRLGQVVDNLIGNAAKYGPPEQEITLTLRAADDQVTFAVQDHGIGIAPEHLPHLFDRFYRAPDAQTRQVHGLGLGLSIVQDLVRAHGGRVWAESAGEGQGSTFLVSLPAAVLHDVPASVGNGTGTS